MAGPVVVEGERVRVRAPLSPLPYYPDPSAPNPVLLPWLRRREGLVDNGHRHCKKRKSLVALLALIPPRMHTLQLGSNGCPLLQ